MKTQKLLYTIEGMSPLFSDRAYDLVAQLLGQADTKSPVSYWDFRQFYTTDEENCFLVDSTNSLTKEEIHEKQIENIQKNGTLPAIPIKYWLDGALYGIAAQVKVKGKITLKDHINNTLAVIERRLPIGEKECFFTPEIIDRSTPAKGGTKKYKEMPGFKSGWIATFTVDYWPDYVTDHKIREGIEIAGWQKGIGHRRKAGNGRFVVKSVKIVR